VAWSTRQIAELAGTAVNTVRHHHEAGLLDEPERRSNGYKQYGVPHLLRLLQIRRLRDLGVPLAQIETLGRADEDPAEALRGSTPSWKNPPTDADKESDNLPPDADAATRRRLAEHYAPIIEQHRTAYPWLNDPASCSAKSAATLQSTMVESLRELYNPAQLEVLVLAERMTTGEPAARPDAAG
jgi:DNA-binding transcriptional MerR regulator